MDTRADLQAGHAPSLSNALPVLAGFEGTAPGGEGPGIERFRPYRGSVELSPRLKIENIASIMPISSEGIDDVLGPLPEASSSPSSSAAAATSNGYGTLAQGTHWRPWSAEERAAYDAGVNS